MVIAVIPIGLNAISLLVLGAVIRQLHSAFTTEPVMAVATTVIGHISIATHILESHFSTNRTTAVRTVDLIVGVVVEVDASMVVGGAGSSSLNCKNFS